MNASLRSRRRVLAVAAAALVVVAIGTAAIFGGVGGGAVATPTAAATDSPLAVVSDAPTGSPATSATPAPTAVVTGSPDFPFTPIDMFAVEPPNFVNPTQAPGVSDGPGDAIFGHDDGRHTPAQSQDWLKLKASGRIVLSNGKIGVLPAWVNPMADPLTGKPVAAARTLDLTWSRWIVEPPGSGRDAKGNRYFDLSYWNLCGPGAATVALYYWQKLTGGPNVTGTAGYFLDPYLAAGSTWPSSGPALPASGGKLVGTYWAGSDRASGFTAHARGYLMYLAMQVKPAGWTSPGIDIIVDAEGKPRYPTLGAPPADIQAALNWEASKHQATGWQNTYYASVGRWDPTLARDLQAAVMLDVGRDGVPVVAAVDTFYLPNWQASTASKTPHTRHAISIVGYNNASNPPTFTYLDTCGRGCNSRGGNRYGGIHVITQANMVQALLAAHGLSFVW
jgi:hypothetical protein